MRCPTVIRPLLLLLALAAAAPAVRAQSWLELKTLVFMPVREDIPHRFAVTAMPASNAPLQADAEAMVREIVELSSTIERQQAEHGPNSPELLDDLMRLAELHQSLGDHADALTALEQARHIVRVSDGLYSLEQVDVIEAMLANLSVAEDYTEVLPTESYLRELVDRNRDDARAVAVLTRIADRQLSAADEFLATDLPPMLTINIQSAEEARWSPIQQPVTERDLARESLWAARRSYSDALSLAVEDDAFGAADLLELEGRIIDTLYWEVLSTGLRPRKKGRLFKDSPLYRLGLDVLNTKRENSRNFPGTPIAEAQALTEFADWQLLFGSNAVALEKYRFARQMLIDAGESDRSIEQLFPRDSPVALPAFAPIFDRADSDRSVQGYFDVRLEIGRYGNVTHFEVLAASPEATESIERRFRSHMFATRFRPRFVDGELARRDEFTMRYTFSYELDDVY